MAKNNKNSKVETTTVETTVKTNSVTEDKKTKTAIEPNTPNNNSIIEVVPNGLDVFGAVAVAKMQLHKADCSIFNAGIMCAYIHGIVIPPYTDIHGVQHGEAVINGNGRPQKECAKLVGRAESTVSGYINAVKKVINAGLFDSIASGLYPFQFDKINAMYTDNGKLKDNLKLYPLIELFSMSTETIKALTLTKPTTSATEDVETETETASTDTTDVSSATEEPTTSVTEEIEYTTIEYNGKKWSVPQKAFELWLAENAKHE